MQITMFSQTKYEINFPDRRFSVFLNDNGKWETKIWIAGKMVSYGVTYHHLDDAFYRVKKDYEEAKEHDAAMGRI